MARPKQGTELKTSPALVIADASPLIALSLVGHLNLLKSLFGKVWVAPIVINEVLTGQFDRGESEIRTALDAGWLVTCDAALADVDLRGLDPGETQSILQAITLSRNGFELLLLMDEQAGRSAAKEYKLTCMGTAGLIAIAKRNGLIPSAAVVLEELLQREFRLSQAIMREVLATAGESARHRS
jgi:predicted nucleic acid-binding protein